MTLRLIAIWLLAATWLAVVPPCAAESESPFVRPAELERDVAFWRRIYTEVSTAGGLLHDPERLDVVYEALEFPPNTAPKQRQRHIEQAKQKYARILRKLAQQQRDLSEEEERILKLWPEGTRPSTFERAAEEVRFQLGQSDRFREGLIRSGQWIDHIATIFERQGLPRELAALPHVESSFNTFAYSKVGAAGMWQFMRSTGRRFVRIDAAVDERLDPYRATEAAARFLEQNYAILKSWPLALTAYNHGPGGMRRAKEQMGTDDIVTIVRKYRSKTFGFASRNFYVAFLAALEIDRDPTRFFGDIKREPPDSSQVVVLPQAVPVQRIMSALHMNRDQLRRINPSLLPSVWNGVRHVPKGYGFRVPQGVDLMAALSRAGIDARVEVAAVGSSAETHRVRRGETLSVIAARYGVSVSALAEINNLKRPYTIQIGQQLELPAARRGIEPAPAVVASVATPVPQPTPPATGVVSGAQSYVVRRGDTLTKVAARHGLSEKELMEINGIRNRNFIYEGQVLALARAARAAPAVETIVPVEPVVASTTEPVATTQNAEPVSETEAEELGPTLVPGVEAAASADPSDYSVAADGTIRVQATETLGHYAEWLDVSAARLRQLNRMSRATPVVIGRRIKIDLARLSAAEFEAKRVEYHKQLQDTFFAQFRIANTETHVVKPGESIWVLAQQRYNVPIWLLRQYNPDLDFAAVRPGTRLVIPILEAVGAADSNL